MTTLMLKKLYLDDRRPCPGGWDLAKTAPEAITMMKETSYDVVSLDHDLGCCKACNAMSDWYPPSDCEHNGNGQHVVDWIEEQSFLNEEFKIPVVHIHTDNGAARVTMTLAARSIERMKVNRENRDPSSRR